MLVDVSHIDTSTTLFGAQLVPVQLRNSQPLQGPFGLQTCFEACEVCQPSTSAFAPVIRQASDALVDLEDLLQML